MTDEQRRSRLVARHHLSRTAFGVLDAIRCVVAFHSSDPATPYLGARARIANFSPEDLDAALCRDRTAWRLHAMRRTLFIVPSEESAIFHAAAGEEIARQERRRLVGWMEAELDGGRVRDLLTVLESRVLDVLTDGVERRTQELTALIPELGTEITLGSGKWTTRSPISSRLLFLMAMDGRIVRTRATGSWRSSQYHWASCATWFGGAPEPLDSAHARAELARRYLAAYGPATVEDLRWWTGWTARRAKTALGSIEVAEVRLDGGETGLVLGDDVEDHPLRDAAASVAFLPALDPTPMGWKSRNWYLGSHAAQLFDRNGNVGPTVWLDGRIVGGWAQLSSGEVVYRILEDVGTEATRRVDEEAAEVTSWLSGVTVTPRFRTPLERSLSGGM